MMQANPSKHLSNKNLTIKIPLLVRPVYTDKHLSNKNLTIKIPLLVRPVYTDNFYVKTLLAYVDEENWTIFI